MKWWVEFGVVIESEPGYFDLDFSNTRRLRYDGNDLQQARRDALTLLHHGPNMLHFDWDKHRSMGTHKTTITSKNACLLGDGVGVPTWAFITIRWSV